jgi:hypothetical protein
VACPIARRKSRERVYHEWRGGACLIARTKPAERAPPSPIPIRKARMGGRDNSGGELNFGEISVGLTAPIHRNAAAHNKCGIDSF